MNYLTDMHIHESCKIKPELTVHNIHLLHILQTVSVPDENSELAYEVDTLLVVHASNFCLKIVKSYTLYLAAVLPLS
jgi:hypothetical protein